MSNRTSMPWWWKVLYGLCIAYAGPLLYLAGITIWIGGVTEVNVDVAICILGFSFMPLMLLGLRYPRVSGVILLCAVVVHLVFVLIVPQTHDDPFAPAVSDYPKFIAEDILLLMLPAIGGSLLLLSRIGLRKNAEGFTPLASHDTN